MLDSFLREFLIIFAVSSAVILAFRLIIALYCWFYYLRGDCGALWFWIYF